MKTGLLLTFCTAGALLALQGMVGCSSTEELNTSLGTGGSGSGGIKGTGGSVSNGGSPGTGGAVASGGTTTSDAAQQSDGPDTNKDGNHDTSGGNDTAQVKRDTNQNQDAPLSTDTAGTAVDGGGSVCTIESTVYPSGTLNPNNPCQSCQPSRSTTSWSEPERPSCAGGLSCNGESCCTSPYVPGGTYSRHLDSGSNEPYPATVKGFCMDKYEVTVGRFKKFLTAYDSWIAAKNPAQGAGEHAPGAGSGWQSSWHSYLPSSATVFKDSEHLNPGSDLQTWGQTNDNLPINNVNWYESFAFCIWDGGRLATEAEWQYAAGHGAENRKYPWGSTEPTNDYVVFNCQWNGKIDECTITDIAAVGSAPKGNGYWGHSDLAGNIWEWGFDNQYGTFPKVCDNCVYIEKTSTTADRVVRGGSYASADYMVATEAHRIGETVDTHQDQFGLRCVRTP